MCVCLFVVASAAVDDGDDGDVIVCFGGVGSVVDDDVVVGILDVADADVGDDDDDDDEGDGDDDGDEDEVVVVITTLSLLLWLWLQEVPVLVLLLLLLLFFLLVVAVVVKQQQLQQQDSLGQGQAASASRLGERTAPSSHAATAQVVSCNYVTVCVSYCQFTLQAYTNLDLMTIPSRRPTVMSSAQGVPCTGFLQQRSVGPTQRHLSMTALSRMRAHLWVQCRCESVQSRDIPTTASKRLTINPKNPH